MRLKRGTSEKKECTTVYSRSTRLSSFSILFVFWWNWAGALACIYDLPLGPLQLALHGQATVLAVFAMGIYTTAVP